MNKPHGNIADKKTKYNRTTSRLTENEYLILLYLYTFDKYMFYHYARKLGILIN